MGKPSTKKTEPKTEPRIGSRWLVGTFGVGELNLSDVQSVRATTAQAAAEEYIRTQTPDPELTVRVWPLRARTEVADFKNTTVQVATAV